MKPDQQCAFCQIIEKKIPTTFIHEDGFVVAFEDLNPQAPVHTLIVPKRHIKDIHSIAFTDRELIGHMFFIAKMIASKKQLDTNTSGYRLVINNGLDAGQTIFHVHLHLLFGRKFVWPPG